MQPTCSTDLHAKYAEYVALLDDQIFSGKTFPELVARLPIREGLRGRPSFLEYDDETREAALVLNPDHGVAMYLHEIAHYYCLLLHPTLKPGPRAEVAAWFLVYRILSNLCGTPLYAPLKWDLRAAHALADKTEKVNMAFGQLVDEWNPALRTPIALEQIVDTGYDLAEVGQDGT